MRDIADDLSRHEPFAGLDREAIEEIARQAAEESFAAGDVIFEQGEDPDERVRIVISGSVELLDQGRTLDLIGEGELFGHPSMLAGLPTGVAARAAEDTLCYRLPTELLVPLLARPEGLRYVARSLLSRQWRPRTAGEGGDPGRRPIGAFIREPPVICEPPATVRDVARVMAERGASCAIIRLPDGELGIVTDQDLRMRVVGGDVPLDASVEHAMSAPAHTVPTSAVATDAMVDMIDRGIRHLPVLSPRGEVLGVVTDIDLLAADTRTPFLVRRRITRAADVEGLVMAARDMRATVIALHDAQVAPLQLAAIISAFADALGRRSLELLTEGMEDLPRFTWLASGSLGRHEMFPASDVDSALVWEGDEDEGERLRGLAGQVLEILERCGFKRDENAASAAHPLFARSTADWRDTIVSWFDRADDTRRMIVISVLADTRPVFSTGAVGDPVVHLNDAHAHPRFMAQLLRMALANRPPTGFLRDIVVQHDGEHRGTLDIKQGGMLPIVTIARYCGLRTATVERSTVQRLRAGAAAGILTLEDAQTLEEAFELIAELRMGHQVDELRAGREPTEFIDPATLNPLMRRYLREAFRAIARTQRRLAG